MKPTEEQLKAILDRPAIAQANPELVKNPTPRPRFWSEAEIATLKEKFCDPKAPVNIQEIADSMQRSYCSVALKASKLGFGSHSRPQRPETIARVSVVKKAQYDALPEEAKRQFVEAFQQRCKGKLPFLGKTHTLETRKLFSEIRKEYHKTHEHPRGMLGKRHSEEMKQHWSEMKKGIQVPRERVIKALKTKLEKYGTIAWSKPNQKRSWKSQWVEIGGKRFFARSLWEANYARYLEFLKTRQEVLEWEHEPETFWFDKIKRGCVSYLPDFKVKLWTGETEFHEVKGWMDDRSKTKIKRMAKYYPEIRLVVIDSPRYRALERLGRKLVPGWQ